MSDEINTVNEFAVGMAGEGIVILMPPRRPMTDDQARRLAAYLVAMTEGGRKEFLPLLDAVENT